MTRPRGKCRILYVIDDMGIGGAQKQIAETVNRIDPGAFQCDIACITSGGPSLQKIRDAGEVHVLGAGKMYDPAGAGAALRLASIVRSGRYAIVEAYLPMAHFLCATAVIGLRNTALVAAVRQAAWLDPLWMDAVGPLLKRVTRLSIANSRYVKQSVIERYRLPGVRVAVIPNFIDTGVPRQDRDESRRRLSLEEGQFVLVAVGNVLPVKDYPTIIRAFAGLRASGRSCALLVAGEGRGRDAAAALASRMGLNGEVRFLGTVADVKPVLAAADVFVHASRSEGMSNAVLEAMAAGLPVVASDIPANREVMGEGCGLFFAPGDWKGCLKEIEHFADDRAAASRAGEEAARRINRVYDSASATMRRERIYRRLAGAVNGNNGESRAAGI